MNTYWHYEKQYHIIPPKWLLPSNRAWLNGFVSGLAQSPRALLARPMGFIRQRLYAVDIGQLVALREPARARSPSKSQFCGIIGTVSSTASQASHHWLSQALRLFIGATGDANTTLDQLLALGLLNTML
jgi:hypothetical protein